MKSLPIFLLLVLFLLSCQSRDNMAQDIPTAQASNNAPDTLPEAAQTGKGNSLPADMGTRQLLALTSDALQLVDRETGSSTEIPFGTPLHRMLEIVNSVLQSGAPEVGLNSECGAGPLKMASWDNGLTLVFQEAKGDWRFVGWYMGIVPANSEPLTTMAGIGIGSTRAEMESAYVIDVSETSLGYEFSTSAGLYGIFSGSSDTATITSLWSGVSCNFR